MRVWTYVDANRESLRDCSASDLVDEMLCPACRAWQTPEEAMAASEADLRERFEGWPYDEGGLPDVLEWTESPNLMRNPIPNATHVYVEDEHPDRILILQDGNLTVMVYPIKVDLGADRALLVSLLAQVALDEPEHWGTTAKAARNLLKRL